MFCGFFKNESYLDFNHTIMEDFFLHAEKIYYKYLTANANVYVRDKGFFTERCLWYKEDWKNKDISVFLLVKEVAEMLKDDGYNINPDHWYLEFHKYVMYEGRDGIGDRYGIGWHIDDNCRKFCVNTAIVYLEKDERIVGGNLLVMMNGIKHTLRVQSKKIILMKGNIKHMVEHIYRGEGMRRSMVFQFERIE